jgi:hypothetical protein
MDEHDMHMESILWPWIDDESLDVQDYDPSCDPSDEDNYDDSMDGDHESGLASAGWGTDEDYGCYGGDEY